MKKNTELQVKVSEDFRCVGFLIDKKELLW